MANKRCTVAYMTWYQMNAAPPGFKSVHLVTRAPRFDFVRMRSILDQFTKFKYPHTRGNLYFFTTILLCCCCIPIKRNGAFTQHRILCATVKIQHHDPLLWGQKSPYHLSSLQSMFSSENIGLNSLLGADNSTLYILQSTVVSCRGLYHLRQLMGGLNAFGKHLPESPVP